jgi:hypothetical protein
VPGHGLGIGALLLLAAEFAEKTGYRPIAVRKLELCNISERLASRGKKPISHFVMIGDLKERDKHP